MSENTIEVTVGESNGANRLASEDVHAAVQKALAGVVEVEADEDAELSVETRQAAQALIAKTCDELKEFLLEKNKKYGNSALEPIRIFSKAEPDEQLRVRIDDKLARIRNGVVDAEDTELDLIGYLLLLRVHRIQHR